MRDLRLTWAMDDAEADALAGTLLGPDSYDVLVEDDLDVYKPNGELLIKFRKGRIPAEAAMAAWANLRDAATPTTNRGLAAGLESMHAALDSRPGKLVKDVDRKHRVRRVKMDGSISNTTGTAPVLSGLVGYFDRSTRFPYCRATAYNLEKPARFAEALPFIRAVDAVFKAEAPERYAAQKEAIAKTHPDFYIHGTVFSTITVNRNWQTAVHKDAGDYKPGFGVMSALRAGDWSGCYLCWPKFRVAVDMRTCDVLLADVHEWHGNTPLVVQGAYERVSCVFYYRETMWKCGSAQEELERAKRKQPGQGVWRDWEDPAAAAWASGEEGAGEIAAGVVEEDEHGQPAA